MGVCDSASCEQEKCNTLWWRSKRFLPTHPRGDTVTAKHDRKDSSSPISPPPPLPSGSATKCCYPVLVTPSRSATKIILLCNGGSGSRLFCKSGRDKPIFSQPVGFPAKCHQIGARWVGGEHNKLKSKIFQSQHKSRGSKRKTLNPNRRPNPKPKYQTTNSSPIPKLEHRKPTPDTKSTNPNPNHQP